MPETVPAATINQACGSGLKAIILAAQEIMLGRSDAVLAGGTESMSRVPYFAEGARWGMRMGNTQLVDGMYRDGFSDPLSGLLMGQTAEKLARQYEISRQEQDEFALRSQQRAEAAIESGRFKDEVMTLEVSGKKGESTSFAQDEHCRAGTTLQDLAKLPPVFYKDGTVTAGNSSGITDGAAAVVVLSEEGLKKFATTPQARIVDYEICGVAPEIMGIGPVPAVRALLNRQRLNLSEIDLIELNEAFAAQVIACDRELAFRCGSFERERRRDRIGPSNRLHRRSHHDHANPRNAKESGTTRTRNTLRQRRSRTRTTAGTRMNQRRKRERALISLCSSLLLAVASCSSQNSSPPSSNASTEVVVSSTPPFQTKEPERYRATRTITSVTADGKTTVTTTSTARDGEMRRTESKLASRTLIFLNLLREASSCCLMKKYTQRFR